MNTSALIDHLVRWLNTYATSHQQNGFIVGVSGGVDSAVCSALCARTGLPTLLLELPIRQAADQRDRGREHCRSLVGSYPSVRHHEVELTPFFEAFVTDVGRYHPGIRSELAEVNTRSRLRLVTLYYFAAVHGYLVVGTGNRVEQDGVGFFAKYGDGGMDLSPIARLRKTEVYRLARALGVNEAILDAPPTDGLWDDGRTDFDQIGASYPELEWAMDLREGGVDTDALDLSPRQRDVLRIYDRRHEDNRHKVSAPPKAPVPDAYR